MSSSHTAETVPAPAHVTAVIEGMRVELGGHTCGQVAEVVLDPLSRQVTHVVVEPHRLVRGARLVPVQQVSFHETYAELVMPTRRFADSLLVEEDHPRDTSGWPHLDETWDVGIVRVLPRPYLASVPTDDGSPAAHLHGVLVDETWHLTDLLLDPPHLWSRPLLPVSVEDVAEIRTDEVLLNLSPEELGLRRGAFRP